ncbi:protein kinase [Micromonospora sp. LOL_023]
MPGLSDLSVFARGGFATVYRAVQESVGREVAVKVENRALDNERDQRRFMREARAAGRMSSHPHVVDLFDVGVTTDTHPYLIMEMCDGSYADRMKTSPLDEFEARDVGVKIADALADAHHLGVLHRDVKPANILYSRFNEPALADFGLAVLVEARDASVTLEVLTPAYAPPESFQHRPPSPAADVYALCATLYAIMRGKPPRWDDERNPSLVMLLELFDQPLPDLPGVNPALTEVLRQGMANDPAARPTALALRDTLAAVPLGPHWSPAAPHRPPFSIAPVSGGPSAGSGGQIAPAPSGQPRAMPVPAQGGSPVPAQGGQPGGVAPQPAAGQAAWSVPVPPPPGHQTGPNHGWHSADDLTTRTSPPAGPTGAAGSPRLRMLASGLGVLVLLAMTSLGTWIVAKGSGGGAFNQPTAVPSGQFTPQPAASGSTAAAGGVLPNCQLTIRPELRCPTDSECFDAQATGEPPALSATACTGRHTWETFVVGELPARLLGADHAQIKADPDIGAACSENVFRMVTLRMDVRGWRFEVLPPHALALADGDHTFRCLAGKGPGALMGPTLVNR